MRSLAISAILAISCIENARSLQDRTFQKRGKRIIDGVRIEETNYYYEGTSWYVYMADGHDCAAPDSWPHHCAKPENLRCGGSLLTPSIVQTSCDCLAAFIGPRQRNVSTACILNNWEKLHIAFVAAKVVDKMTEGYLSWAFYIHERCAKLAVEPTHLTTHDYGFVKLRKDVKQTGRDVPIKYVPIYSMKSLARLWSYNLNNGVVCMTLGYGSYKVYPETGLPSSENSPSILHSWVMLYDYVRCYYLTKLSKDTLPNYFEYATWTCLTRLPNNREKSYLAPGDGGSPVTCNNHYFGVAGEHVHDLGLHFHLQFAAAVAFTPFQNAIEFREEFEKNLKLILLDPTFRPTFFTLYPLVERGYISSQASLSDGRVQLCIVALYIIIS